MDMIPCKIKERNCKIEDPKKTNNIPIHLLRCKTQENFVILEKSLVETIYILVKLN
jgi:hypothetical protein